MCCDNKTKSNLISSKLLTAKQVTANHMDHYFIDYQGAAMHSTLCLVSQNPLNLLSLSAFMRLISVTPNINLKHKIGSFSYKARIPGTRKKNGHQISNMLSTTTGRTIPTKPTITE